MSDVQTASAGAFPVPGLTPPAERTGAKRRIGDVIVQLGFTDRETVEASVGRAREQGMPLGQALIEDGVVNSHQLARALAERNGLDYVDLNEFEVDKGAAHLLDPSKARRYRTIPIAFMGERTLLVATADPANVLALDDITMATGYEVRRAVASAEDIEALVGHALQARRVGAGARPRGRGAGAGHRASRVGGRRPGGQAGAHRDRRRRGPRRLRHPLRAPPGRHARALPHRRRGVRLHHRAAAPRGRPRLPGQDHVRPRHRRAPGAAGRPRRPHRGRPPRGPPCGHPAGGARRVRGHANPGRRPVAHHHQRPRDGGRRADPLRALAARAHPRRHPRDRPHRLGQDHHALRGPGRAQHPREDDRDDRGPGGVRDGGHQAGAGEREGAPHLRRRPAVDGPGRPGRDHGRRDPGPRDGADRHRVRAHRPPGAQHPAHQRRARWPRHA